MSGAAAWEQDEMRKLLVFGQGEGGKGKWWQGVRRGEEPERGGGWRDSCAWQPELGCSQARLGGAWLLSLRRQAALATD